MRQRSRHWPAKAPRSTARRAGMQCLTNDLKHAVDSFGHGTGNCRTRCLSMAAAPKPRGQTRTVQSVPRAEGYLRSATCLLDEQNADLNPAQADCKVNQVFRILWDGPRSQQIVARNCRIGD